jgi:hypothetical protein
LQKVYNLSAPLAYFLTIVGLFVCGTGPPWRRTLDLAQLARHNALEHDASLGHADASPGARYAPITVDPHLLEAFQASFPEGGMDEAGLVRYRAARERALGEPFRGLWASRFALVSASEAMIGFDVMQNPHTGYMSHARIAVRPFLRVLYVRTNG